MTDIPKKEALLGPLNFLSKSDNTTIGIPHNYTTIVLNIKDFIQYINKYLLALSLKHT